MDYPNNVTPGPLNSADLDAGSNSNFQVNDHELAPSGAPSGALDVDVITSAGAGAGAGAGGGERPTVRAEPELKPAKSDVMRANDVAEADPPDDGRKFDTPGGATRKTTLAFIKVAMTEGDCGAILAAASMRKSDPKTTLQAICAFGQMCANAEPKRVQALVNTGCIDFICEAIKTHHAIVFEDCCAVLWSVSMLADGGAKVASEFTLKLARKSCPVILHSLVYFLEEDKPSVCTTDLICWGLGVLCYLTKQADPASLKEFSSYDMIRIVCKSLIKLGSHAKIAQWGIGILSSFDDSISDPEVIALIRKTGMTHRSVPAVSHMVQLALKSNLEGADTETRVGDGEKKQGIE